MVRDRAIARVRDRAMAGVRDRETARVRDRAMAKYPFILFSTQALVFHFARSTKRLTPHTSRNLLYEWTLTYGTKMDLLNSTKIERTLNSIFQCFFLYFY